MSTNQKVGDIPWLTETSFLGESDPLSDESDKIIEELKSQVIKYPRKRFFLVGRAQDEDVERIQNSLMEGVKDLLYVKMISPVYVKKKENRWLFVTV